MFKWIKNLLGITDVNQNMGSEITKMFNNMLIQDVYGSIVDPSIHSGKSYFKLSEFKCSDGCVMPDNAISTKLVDMLNQAREIAGKPWKITSGYRCAAHNKAVGGVAGSSHTLGTAVDIAATTSNKKFEVINAALKVGFTRIGVGKTFIHLDIDSSKPQNVVWLY